MMELSKIRNQWFINQVKLLEKKGLSKAQIARDIGVLPQYLTPILAGKRNVSDQLVAKLSNAYGINQIDLSVLDLNTNISNDSGSSEKKKKPQPSSKTQVGIPFIPSISITNFFKGDLDNLECEQYIIPLFKGADFLLSVRDSSMQPTYNSGDVVACQKVPSNTFFQWNKIYVLDTEQGALVKRVKKGSSDDTIILSSDNSKYTDFEIHRSKIQNIALVIGVMRLE